MKVKILSFVLMLSILSKTDIIISALNEEQSSSNLTLEGYNEWQARYGDSDSDDEPSKQVVVKKNIDDCIKNPTSSNLARFKNMLKNEPNLLDEYFDHMSAEINKERSKVWKESLAISRLEESKGFLPEWQKNNRRELDKEVTMYNEFAQALIKALEHHVK